MDNLAHSLAGLAIAEAGPKRTTAYATATAVVGANLPDIDIVSYFAGSVHALGFRRGWTHGVLAMVVLPIVLVLAALAWERVSRRDQSGDGQMPVRPRALLLVAVLAVWSHPLLDLLNTYGVRLLMPFSDRWFYGDALFIVDPWLWAILTGGIAIGRWRRRQGALSYERPARVGLIVAAVYALAMAGTSAVAREALPPPTGSRGTMVSPGPGRPLVKFVVRDLGGSYETGVFNWLAEPRYTVLDTLEPGPVRAIRAPEAGARLADVFLSWARFPRAIVTPAGDSARVLFTDVRYSGGDDEESWATLSLTIPAPAGTAR